MSRLPASTRSKNRTLIFGAVYAIYLMFLVAAGWRVLLWSWYSVSPVDLSNRVDVCELHYRELFQRKIHQVRRVPGELQILLLGGSVAEQTGGILQEQLSVAVGATVRVHNAAVSAHTTRDSFNKIRCLTERGAMFDHVIVYHGINDVQMNCVATEDFRDDYSHCSWYAAFDRLRASGGIRSKDVLRDRVSRTILLGKPEADHREFGSVIKTGKSFGLNLRAIVKIADDQKTPVTLMTFAACFPDDYSKERFEAKQLGFAEGQYGQPTELWGMPENVERGVAAHNHVIRSFAAERPDLKLIEMDLALGQSASYFTDVCHLSQAGLEEFARVVARELRSVLQSKR